MVKSTIIVPLYTIMYQIKYYKVLKSLQKYVLFNFLYIFFPPLLQLPSTTVKKMHECPNSVL